MGRKKSPLIASTAKQTIIRGARAPKATSGLAAPISKRAKLPKGTKPAANPISRKSGPRVGAVAQKFNFDTSAKPATIKSEFSGPIGYPSMPGAKKHRWVGKGWRFKTPRPLGATVRPATISPASQPTLGQYMIHGIQVGSKNEYYLYEALLQLGVPDYAIGYQVPWHGGRALGGQVLDFVISMGGADTVLRMQGHYWHPTAYGKPLDVYTMSQLQGEGYRVEDIYDYNATSVPDAVSTLNRMRVV